MEWLVFFIILVVIGFISDKIDEIKKRKINNRLSKERKSKSDLINKNTERSIYNNNSKKTKSAEVKRNVKNKDDGFSNLNTIEKIVVPKIVQNKSIIIEKDFKPLWKSMNIFLEHVGVTKFYHFTDLRNLQSIIKEEGLYSWYGLEKKSINSFLSSNKLSRDLDIRHNLQDYIRLSFTDYNPMSSRLIHEEKKQLIWLEIELDVAFFKDTLFSDKNATDNNVIVSSEFEFLKTLNFEIFKKRYNTLDFNDKKAYQAEILVKDFLPIKYIKNIEQLKKRYL